MTFSLHYIVQWLKYGRLVAQKLLDTLDCGVLIISQILSSPRAVRADRKSQRNEHMAMIACKLTVSQLTPQKGFLSWTGGEAPPACQWAPSPVNQPSAQGLLSHTHYSYHLHPEWAALRVWVCEVGGGAAVQKRKHFRGWAVVNPVHMPVSEPAALRDHWEKDLFLDMKKGWG